MRRTNLTPALLTLAFLALLLGAYALPARSAPAWHAQVDRWILDTLAEEGEAEFLVFLASQADLSGAPASDGKQARGAYVVEQLKATAAGTQQAVIAELERLGVRYQPYWIANMIWVRGSAAVVEQLAQRSDVAHLYANPRVPIALPEPERAARAPETVEQSLSHIGAPAAWAMGITGAGVVVGGQDTGYQWDHPALVVQYRGWDGSSANHNYHWHDAIRGDVNTTPGNPCGFNSPVPCDDDGHGTHTMGTMVGDDGATNQIGVAPGARWIGCRNMEQGAGTPATYTECFQWFVEPTDLTGANPNSDFAPDVINNSWTCPASEGCTDPNALLAVVANTRAAGIVVVAAAGNSGPSCSTIGQPPAIYDASFTVGATDLNDTIASFSGRGPVTVDGSSRLKPDVTAPGVSIRSSVPYDSYGTSYGTSMATPHVSGLIALLLQARPDLLGNVEGIEALIRDTALPLTTSQGCGGDEATLVPNYVYGYGRVDAGALLSHIFPYRHHLPLIAEGS